MVETQGEYGIADLIKISVNGCKHNQDTNLPFLNILNFWSPIIGLDFATLNLYNLILSKLGTVPPRSYFLLTLEVGY
jgi:hypothetical protein